ncbi:MAG: Transcriptional regulator, GntR family with LacI sensor [Candidatus Uhrbacteria bacterium GW2011_GWF2_39_13]|uniref:Transcriptional regulator, GntR family with LacI sensor n=1 Tax=Candidatus Uhrbacteria bacterium GW2011_GWF2_39_13 TaxID=1618995 RepID=A0A0G0MU57_9BACT|nr:MAG: Transcriptional regulator, GntR family with LacI sensor [Candidatus Uhrbacteria bacterium GW2011_GWF2_39_13]
MIIKEKPKFEQLKDLLLRQFKSGRYKAGDKIPSETELAEKYGLNRETVNKTILTLVASGTLIRKRGCGTYIAIPRKEQRLKLGIVICPAMISDGQPVEMFNYVDVFGGISKATAELNCELEIISKEKFRFYAEDILGFVKDKKLDGILSYGYNPNDEKIAVALKNESVPYVVIACWDNGGKVNLVTVDIENGCLELVKYLLGKGHSNIACLSISEKAMISIAPRIRGIVKALSLNNVYKEKYSLKFENNNEIGHTLDALLKTRELPSAILTTTDLAAFSVIEHLGEKGIRTPNDISIASIDDIEKASISEPPLTTLRIPRDKMGYEGVMLTVKLKKSANGSFEKVVIATELKIRESCIRMPAKNC